jgi:hypothetical protein
VYNITDLAGFRDAAQNGQFSSCLGSDHTYRLHTKEVGGGDILSWRGIKTGLNSNGGSRQIVISLTSDSDGPNGQSVNAYSDIDKHNTQDLLNVVPLNVVPHLIGMSGGLLGF